METNKHLACVLKAATWDFYVLFILAPPVDKKNQVIFVLVLYRQTTEQLLSSGCETP